MQNFIVEYDLIPVSLNSIAYPITRRVLIEADGIREALTVAKETIKPGQDCVAIRILDFDHDMR